MDTTHLHSLAMEGIALETDLSAGQDVTTRYATWLEALDTAGVNVKDLPDDLSAEDLNTARLALKAAIDQTRNEPPAPREEDEELVVTSPEEG